MSRRPTFIALSAFAILTLSACSAAVDGSAGVDGSDLTLTWETTGGEATEQEKEAFQDPFTEETGTEFENVTSSTVASQLQTMVDSGNTVWDVVHTGSFLAERFCGELFEEIDLSALPDDLFPDGTTSECAKPVTKYATVFGFDASTYDEAPSQIEDFFDVKAFPGKRVVLGASPRGILEAALVADGVDPEELFPLDIDRALRKLGTIKSDLIFAQSFTALQQNVVDEQATMTITLSGRLSIINESGGDLQPVWDFTSWDFDALVVPMGSPKKEAARDAIEFALQPEQVIRYAELSGSTPARNDIEPASIDYPESKRLFNAFLEDRGTLVAQDAQWWAENNAAATEAYVAWQVR